MQDGHTMPSKTKQMGWTAYPKLQVALANYAALVSNTYQAQRRDALHLRIRHPDMNQASASDNISVDEVIRLFGILFRLRVCGVYGQGRRAD